MKLGVGEGSIREDNLALARMVRRDRLMGNFHLMKVTLFMRNYLLNCENYCSYDIVTKLRNNIFFDLMKDQNTQK